MSRTVQVYGNRNNYLGVQGWAMQNRAMADEKVVKHFKEALVVTLTNSS